MVRMARMNGHEVSLTNSAFARRLPAIRNRVSRANVSPCREVALRRERLCLANGLIIDLKRD